MNNIDKILQYLQLVSKEPIDVDGQMYDRCSKINSIQLSSTFFYTDRCDSCGCCDVPEDNVYVQFEYDKIMSITEQEYHAYNSMLDMNKLQDLRNGLVKHIHKINGKDIPVYVYKLRKQHLYLSQKGKVVERCSWAFNADTSCDPENQPFTRYYCHIHPVTSITCKMPHLRFMNNSRSTTCRIGIYQFGRNWATKCPVTFSEPRTEEQWIINKTDRLNKLKLLMKVAQDLNIDTYLPEIIEYVENVQYPNYQTKLCCDIITKKTQLKCKKLF